MFLVDACSKDLKCRNMMCCGQKLAGATVHFIWYRRWCLLLHTVRQRVVVGLLCEKGLSVMTAAACNSYRN
uniref:Uncharacterized protein n=1 Tax=Arundo donax TaxID=35708 RepID=A0A0A9BY55_ARUDO